MAIYRRGYKAYNGPQTAAWSRCLVLFRYSRKTLFRSKFQTGLFVVSFFFPLGTSILLSLLLSLILWLIGKWRG